MSFGEKITDELVWIRTCAVLAGACALLNGEIGAAMLAYPVYLLARVLDLIFRHPAIVR